MSALNIIQQEHATHLITDGASYAPDGTILSVHPKLYILEEIGAAIAFRGRWITRVPVAMGTVEDFDDFLDALTPGCHALQAAIDKHGRDGLPEELMSFECVAVGFSKRKGRTGAWGLTTRPKERGGLFEYLPGTKAFDLAEMPALVTGPEVSLSALFGRIETLDDVDALDPVAAARTILEAQRAKPWPFAGGEVYCVGGHGEMATVTREGVTTQTVVEWPDRVGEKIQPVGSEVVPRLTR